MEQVRGVEKEFFSGVGGGRIGERFSYCNVNGSTFVSVIETPRKRSDVRRDVELGIRYV
jgi:hypothetical protein